MLEIFVQYIRQTIVILASAYGSGAYNNACNYNGTGCTGGLLPGTGGVIWPIIFGAMIIAGLTLIFWLWQRRRQRSKSLPTSDQSN